MTTLNSLLKGELTWLAHNSNLSVLKLDGIEYKDLRFPNEESYRGGWKESKPEGEGCYTWADGSTYEGAWHAGLKHGWGKYRWPNQACYLGEWRDGFMQGYGTFESPDGARYSGNWQANLKHGIGKKVYGNGDSYEGLWRNGKAEGPGRYVWHNGNQYDGEWRAGKMHGQGTLKWITGERYDGEWSEGQEEGIGVFTWRDGSTYEGFWEGGKKAGVGVFRPTPNAAAAGAAASSELARSGRPHIPGVLPGRPVARVIESVMDAAMDVASAAAGAVTVAESPPPKSPLGGDAPLDSPSAAFAMHRRDRLAQDGAAARSSSAAGPAGEPLVFVCQYDNGKLLHEEPLSTSDLELIFGPGKQAVDKGPGRLRRGRRGRRQVRLGETIYKGHRSYDLMLNLQLGIRYTITTLSKLPAPATLSEQHLKEKVWLRFPREGSEVTPPHPSNDFKWKDYCTTAFKRLRMLFGIDNSQYILSICGDQALREMASPGKSGSVFFISHDDQFMIKTMHKEEIKLLLSMMPKYVKHVEANPETLLTRFYGVHRVKPTHGRKVRFVVMNNVFRTDLDLHSKYDLKGSTFGRTAGPRPGSTAIRKDLDLDVSFKIDPKVQATLSGQLAADCSFLEDIRVMDYSLLLGLHRRRLGDTSACSVNSDKEEEEDAYLSAGEVALDGALGEEEGSDSEDEEDEEEEDSAGKAFFHPSSASLPHPSVGALLPEAPSGTAIGPHAAAAASRRRRRSASGLAVAPTSDTDAEVARSMHSVTIEQQQSAAQQTSPRPEGRSPSFLLKGLTWRSFTAGHNRRPSQSQLAPALGMQPQAMQPPASAQITPRVQPSVLPTPRLAAAAPQVPALANGSSKELQPMDASPGIIASLRAAAAAGGEEGAAAGAAQHAGPAAAAGSTGGNAQSTHRRQQQQQHERQQERQQDEHQQQQQWQLQEQQRRSAEEQAAEEGLLTWRSDAVQLPEQQLLPEGIPASPTASLDTAGSFQRGRSSTVPVLGAIPELSNSAVELADSAEAGEEVEQPQRRRQGDGEAPLSSAEQQDTPTSRPPRSSPPGSSPPGASPPPAAAAVEVAAAGAGAKPGAAATAGRGPALPADSPGSQLSSQVSSAATTPTGPSAAGTGGQRGRPLPGGVPRIALQRVPGPGLQPQRDSNEWMHYAESVSDAGLSAKDPGSDLRSPQHTRSSTPESDAASPPSFTSFPRLSPPAYAPASVPAALPSARGAGAVGGAVGGAGGGAGGGTGGGTGGGGGGASTQQQLFRGTPFASPSAGARRAGLSSAPTTARSPLGSQRDDGPASGTAGGGSTGPSPAAAVTVHRLAQSAGPQTPPHGGSLTGTAAATPELSPHGSGGRSGGLGRTTSAPAGQLLAAASGECHRRNLSQQHGADRHKSMLVRRQASVADLASPEAAAVVGRINTRLTRRVTDQLVQDLVKLAKYRMVGAVGRSPSARHSRMPTMVLAARHMRRSSGGTTPPQVVPHAHHATSSQDEGGTATPGGVRAAAAAGSGGDDGLPRRLGIGVPAVALSQQAGQGPEEVVLFFGIIDFLQEYNMRKMLEHSFKAVVQDAKAISVVEPHTYAKRFLKFMERVFPPSMPQQQQQ